MAAAETSRAIGAVSELLKEHLESRIAPGETINVSIGRPDFATNNPRINLFLYEANFDPSMRSLSLDQGRPAPLWLALRFLLTAHDGVGQSETSPALRLLGGALRVVQELGYLPIVPLFEGDDTIALQSNPEPLKVSFVDVGSELLGRLMQGTDEKYRFAMAFEVRPVMIATRETNEDALLVGSVNLAVEPEVRAPVVDRVDPDLIEPGTIPPSRPLDLDIIGTNVRTGDIPLLSGVELPAITRNGNTLVTTITLANVVSAELSAGVHTFVVREAATTSGRRRLRTTPPVLIKLRPTVGTVNVLEVSDEVPTPGGTLFRVKLEILGVLLGGPDDDAIVSLWAGTTVASSDELDPIDPLTADPLQPRREVILHRVPEGRYRVIVRVNGVQAALSPVVGVGP